MRRLIDVADLEKFIREHRCVIGDDNLLLVATDDGRWQEALPLIKTAYDVDEVVKEINEWTFNANIDVGDGTIMNHNLIVRDTAINIVKAGGNIELPEHSKSQSD
jgi:hypothetical protein